MPGMEGVLTLRPHGRDQHRVQLEGRDRHAEEIERNLHEGDEHDRLGQEGRREHAGAQCQPDHQPCHARRGEIAEADAADHCRGRQRGQHRDHPVAEADLVAVAELDRGERLRRFELQHREIGLLVDADQLGLDLGAVVEDDVDLVGIGDDVVVGDDDAGGVDDEARAERIGLARLELAALVAALAGRPAAVLEEVVEEFLERRARRQLRHRAALVGLDRLRGRDVDDGVDHLLGNVGDAATHAGAGGYSIEGRYAQNKAEYSHGVARFWDAKQLPAPLARYMDLVRQFNPDGQLRQYPGSPAIANLLMRADDRLRVYLYHIPPVSAVPITHKLVERLMKAYPKQIAGMKDSSDDWPHTKSMIDAFAKDGFDVFSGNEKPLIENVKSGGAGCISATANVNPAAISSLCANWTDSDADAQQQRLDLVRSLFSALPMIPAMKTAVAQTTGKEDWKVVRPPLISLTAAQETQLLSSMKEAGFSMKIDYK